MYSTDIEHLLCAKNHLDSWNALHEQILVTYQMTQSEKELALRELTLQYGVGK